MTFGSNRSWREISRETIAKRRREAEGPPKSGGDFLVRAMAAQNPVEAEPTTETATPVHGAELLFQAEPEVGAGKGGPEQVIARSGAMQSFVFVVGESPRTHQVTMYLDPPRLWNLIEAALRHLRDENLRDTSFELSQIGVLEEYDA